MPLLDGTGVVAEKATWEVDRRGLVMAAKNLGASTYKHQQFWPSISRKKQPFGRATHSPWVVAQEQQTWIASRIKLSRL